MVICWALVAAPSGGSDNRAELRTLQAQAQKSFREGHFAGTVNALEKAYALYPHPDFLFNIAVAYDRWGQHCAAALLAVRRYRDACATTKCRALEDAEAIRARLEPACPASVVIGSIPPGARVLLDGIDVGTATVTVSTIAGEHVVGVSLDGYEASTQTFSVLGGTSHKLELTLARIAPPPPSPLATATPPPEPAIVMAPEPEDRRPANPYELWGWTGVGVGAASLVASGIFLGLELGARSSADDAKMGPDARIDVVNGHLSTAAGMGYARSTTFIIGLTSAAAGAALLLFLDEPE